MRQSCRYYHASDKLRACLLKPLAARLLFVFLHQAQTVTGFVYELQENGLKELAVS